MGPSEVLQLAGSVGGLAAFAIVVAYVVAPKALDTWKSRHRDDTELAKTVERENTERHRIDADGHALAADLMRERADEHRACREELAELRGEVGILRASCVGWEAKHDAAQREVSTLRALVDRLLERLSRLERRSDPPTSMEPAE